MMEQLHKGKTHLSPDNRIRFNLSSHDLQCFISKQPNQRSKYKCNSQAKSREQPLIRVIQGYTPNKCNNSPYLDFCFDHKVLFTNYGQLEVYVDEQPKILQSTKQQNQNTNQNQTDDLQSEEVISQCVRAITQDTNDNSSVDYASLNAYKFYNQQIIDNAKTRSKFNAEEPVYSISPTQAQFDGRTTLMLRNIPNKYTQQMVLQEVEAAGLELKYDFFYLPIDFKNDCNVGYAFINLVDVRYVQVLYEKFHGKKWPRFNSQKICQVCYARIQGTPQLLNHFRFSNTLQRDNRFRPLIYLNLNLADNKMRENNYKTDKDVASYTI